MFGSTRIDRAPSIPLITLALACVLGCQVLNPAFGLLPDSGGGGESSSTTDGLTGPVLTTSLDTTAASTATSTVTSIDPDTTGDPTTVDPTTDGATTSTGTSTTDPVSSSEPPPGCGNGVLDPNEECDDGNLDDSDDCTGQCKQAACGDGIVHVGVEACDDGNDANFDDCPVDCQPTCGDGEYQPDREECDPTAVPFSDNNFAGLCTPECRVDSCFRMLNTDAVDLAAPTWFDECAEAQGVRVAVLVRDGAGVYYLRSGFKTGMGEWTPTAMTSPAPPSAQWKLSTHMYKVPLIDLLLDKPGEFDVLYAFGRDALPLPKDAAKCPSSLGDGYAVAILPEQDTTAARLILMPYEGLGVARNLAGWTDAGPGVELAYAHGALMALCDGQPTATPFLGEVAIAVY